MEKSDILNANEDFFRAISEMNIELMKALWLIDDSSICISSQFVSSDPIVRTGFTEIIEYFDSNFKKTAPNYEYVTRYVELNFQGDLAIVSCELEPKAREGFFDSRKSPGIKHDFLC